MKKRYLFVTFILVGVSYITGKAQDYDLKELRQAPEKNSLPVRTPNLSIRDVDIQDPTLNLKINYWRNWTTFSINANQATFSDNWSNGGVNSVSLGAFFNTKWDYTRENKNFVSELDLRYGKLWNDDQLARKSQDRIWWDNKYSVKFAQKWAFFASLTFETQFDAGWEYGTTPAGKDTLTRKISNFMAPGYLTQSLGVEFKPDAFSSIRFGTGTARQTFVLDDSVKSLANDGYRYGIEIPGHFRNEIAFQLLATTDRDLSKMLHLKATYELFANYQAFDKIRHRLDMILTANVSRVISVLFNTTFLYDPLQLDEIQRSQTLGIGVTYKFPR